MNDRERLDIINTIFKDQGYSCSIIEESDTIPFPHLQLNLGPDGNGSNRIMHIIIEEQILDQSFREVEEPGNPILRLVFDTELPFKVDPTTAREVGTLLHFINREIDLPGFELAEVEDKVYFRHVQLTREAGVDVTVIYSIVGLTLFYLNWFSSVIESLAKGETTFNEVLENVLKISQEMK
ncbi:MAG: hypothetical protein H7A37_06015 [Chlamydiales bacterium]|nr:hypothetical protein [Chlamydiia bacterium]MCP5507837.1 hypothetical protein [Chlamydiales bacterium]